MENILLQNLREGSVTAFDSLYQTYSGKLYGFVMSIAKNDAYIAEEIVQQTFIKVWENRETILPEKSFVSFLYTIAHHLLINLYRRQTIEYIYQEYCQQQEPETTHSETETQIELNSLKEYFNRIADQLPDGRKTVFRMSRNEYLTNKEIAARLNISESTVEKQLSAALRFIKQRFMANLDKLILLAAAQIMLK